MTDWVAWHQQYEQDGSPHQRRLAMVQGRIRQFIDAAPPGPIRAISMCAGQGRDIIGALIGHPRRFDVVARLVELDPANVTDARVRLAKTDLAGIEVVQGDAAEASVYEDAVPADLVLACGIFGNISDADIHHTVTALPMFCAPDAWVIWTRHRGEPDLTPTIRGWFEQAGFDEVGFDPIANALQSVGTQRLRRRPPAFDPSVKLFEFVK